MKIFLNKSSSFPNSLAECSIHKTVQWRNEHVCRNQYVCRQYYFIFIAASESIIRCFPDATSCLNRVAITFPAGFTRGMFFFFISTSTGIRGKQVVLLLNTPDCVSYSVCCGCE